MKKTCMALFLSVASLCTMVLTVTNANAATVTDSRGTFTLDTTPKRIVALEFSFVDALAVVGVSPVGIADDNDRKRILPAIREKIAPWTSVGTRSQPSLEVIASLKPDLIIADVDRHSAVFNELEKIAPTLLLPSRRETYTSNLRSAAIIGKVVGKDHEMQDVLAKHDTKMNDFKQRFINKGFADTTLLFGVARENGFYAHAQASYAGGVIQALGLKGLKKLDNETASRQISLEQLLALNPDYLIVGDYTSNSIITTQWDKQPLWSLLTAAKEHHIYHVDGNLWARCRGILAAEQMANDLMHNLLPAKEE